MFIHELRSLIVDNLGHRPTAGQEMVIEALGDYLLARKDRIFLIRGYAGTGKTSLVASLVKSIEKFRLRSVLLAPTGRAAKVMSRYSGSPAYTIHKKIYRQNSVADGFAEFSLDRNMHRNTLFIVDEASMIANQSVELSVFGSGRLLDDLIAYVFSGSGCKLILIGDDAQLPPVGFDQSDALDPRYLQRYGFPVEVYYLDEVVRQGLDSGVLFNATRLRSKINPDVHGYPGLMTGKFTDFILTTGENLTDMLESSYHSVGQQETIVLCRSNKLANRYNKGIRSMILHYDEDIRMGDLVMVVRNNYHWLKESDEVDFIANGDILEVTRVKGTKELYGFDFRDLSVRFTDYRVMEFDAKAMLDTLYTDGPALDKEQTRNLFSAVSEDYQHMKGKKHKADAIRDDPYYNALQLKFAYAITCHKAQGGQWKHVYIDQGWQTEANLDREYYRWLYTAITRATEKVFLVNFKDEFFEQ
jgi:exodeoxyribonuclease V